MKILKIINLLISTILLIYTLNPTISSETVNPIGLAMLGGWQYLGNFLILFIHYISNSRPFKSKLRGIYIFISSLTLIMVSLIRDIEGFSLIPLAICAFGYTYICIIELDIKLTNENIHHRWLNI